MRNGLRDGKFVAALCVVVAIVGMGVGIGLLLEKPRSYGEDSPPNTAASTTSIVEVATTSTITPPTTTTTSPPPTTRTPTTSPRKQQPSTTTTTTARRQPPVRTYRYSVASRGHVRSDLTQFARHARTTLDDSRGWAGNGVIRFTQVPSGGDFTLWLAAPNELPLFHSTCSVDFSCRVGKNVVINDDRWRTGTQLKLSLEDYRRLVVNHEVGHLLGLFDTSCPKAGGPARVMQQQSKGGEFMGGCTPNPWPLAGERTAADAIARKG